MNSLNNLWLMVGVIYVAVSLKDLFYYGLSGTILFNLAIGALVVYTSVYNMGGWEAVKYKIKRLFR